jgi:cytidylate kinase
MSPHSIEHNLLIPIERSWEMAVITISREFGSGGGQIARMAAQALGYRFVDKEFIAMVLSQYGLVEFDKEYETLPSFWEKFKAQKEARRDDMVNMLNRVVRAVAQQGDVVILGRSGFAILGEFADVLHVRVQAPFASRVRRVMRLRNITAFQAEDIVEQGDRVRAAFVKSFYGLGMDTAKPFDIMINTAKIPPEIASNWVVEALENWPDRENILPERATSSIEVGPILAAAVTAELEASSVKV